MIRFTILGTRLSTVLISAVNCLSYQHVFDLPGCNTSQAVLTCFSSFCWNWIQLIAFGDLVMFDSMY